MNNISLKDFLEKMKELPDDIDFNFEGQGDGTVKVVFTEKKITITDKKFE